MKVSNTRGHIIKPRKRVYKTLHIILISLDNLRPKMPFKIKGVIPSKAEISLYQSPINPNIIVNNNILPGSPKIPDNKSKESKRRIKTSAKYIARTFFQKFKC
ncbi:MAG: hypothetical protein Q8P92_00625 [Candidatus Daviesbacteria bacterium]|nr:hypothetical protein [Candidatus Daviesbacteria bacterium]